MIVRLEVKVAPAPNQRLGSADGTVFPAGQWGLRDPEEAGGAKELINTPGRSFLPLGINNRKKSLLPLKASQSHPSEILPPRAPGLSTPFPNLGLPLALPHLCRERSGQAEGKLVTPSPFPPAPPPWDTLFFIFPTKPSQRLLDRDYLAE